MGERAALDILRRHRLIETFLVVTRTLDWSLVHTEAARLERAVSPVVLQALDSHLGGPSVDPHGDPIPDVQGKVRAPRGEPLSALKVGARFRVTRITAQDVASVSFVAKHGLRPVATGTIMGMDAMAQSLTVRSLSHDAVTLAISVASEIVYEPLQG